MGSAHWVGGDPFDVVGCAVHMGMPGGPKGDTKSHRQKRSSKREGLQGSHQDVDPLVRTRVMKVARKVKGQEGQGPGQEGYILPASQCVHIKHGRELITLLGRTKCPFEDVAHRASQITRCLGNRQTRGWGWRQEEELQLWPHPLPFRSPGIQQSLCGSNDSLQEGVTLADPEATLFGTKGLCRYV